MAKTKLSVKGRAAAADFLRLYASRYPAADEFHVDFDFSDGKPHIIDLEWLNVYTRRLLQVLAFKLSPVKGSIDDPAENVPNGQYFLDRLFRLDLQQAINAFGGTRFTLSP